MKNSHNPRSWGTILSSLPVPTLAASMETHGMLDTCWSSFEGRTTPIGEAMPHTSQELQMQKKKSLHRRRRLEIYSIHRRRTLTL